MARPKKQESDSGTVKEVKAFFTGHRNAMAKAGFSMLEISRPRGKYYGLEEWLGADRRIVILKVYDDGRTVRFDETTNNSQGQ